MIGYQKGLLTAAVLAALFGVVTHRPIKKFALPPTIDPYAKINQSSNLIIDIEQIDTSTSGSLDPTFTWVDISSISPQPAIGWTYNGGSSFTAPGLPNDVYGYSVTVASTGGLDYYTNSQGYTATVSTGASSGPAYLSLAIQDNLAVTKAAAFAYPQTRYDLQTQQTLIGIYLYAQYSATLLNPFSNRLAYIAQIFPWQGSIYSYITTYVNGVKALTGPGAVAGTSANFTQFNATDPLISPSGALNIPN